MEKSHVSMEKKLCPICGHEFETNSLLLDRRLKASMERYTVTGYGHCPDCQSKLDDDYIALVEINNSREVKTLKLEEAYRTGTISWVKKHVCAQIFNVEIKTPMIFITSEVTSYLQSLTPQEA